ncbi:MAG: glycosyltransferase family 4 protein [Thermodesulfovibrio sp.]|jgi:glycosyltransferase involved in cell wall biosynthesis|uniref:Glycosyltransferase family 1 protein n=1 Tax=Thermodesulfovibrio aggregans TaxID=86166 RepID=A0A2J6WJB9_9BACT|nr:MAG: glycosyltransferase family 1 protein [Thermodesulfovibrio aggregans]
MFIKILHTESSPGWGGQENRILNESIGLQKLGAKVYILCQPESKLAEKAREAGIEVFTSPMRKSYDLKAIYNTARLINKLNIDVVNTHSGKDSYIGGFAGKLSKKTPLIVRTRHLALPITSTFSYKYLSDFVVTVSEYVRQYLIQKGIPEKKVFAVPTGIDLEKFNPGKVKGTLKKELGLNQDTPLIATVAVLRKKKGHHILIEAIPYVLKKFPEAVFVFVGEGPQRKNIEEKIKRHGLSKNVIMLGHREDIPQILSSIDLFVLPTLQEALGTSFIEAMAMGKPVIGSNIDGVREVIDNGLNGYLVPPEAPVVLAEKIIDLLSNRGKAKEFGVHGREKVENKYTIEKMCNGMLEVYLKHLKKL